MKGAALFLLALSLLAFAAFCRMMHHITKEDEDSEGW